MHGGFGRFITSSDQRPKVTWALLKRVVGYARPYIWLINGMLVVTLITSGLSLLTPLILRALIDRVLHHCHLVNIRGNSYRMREHTDLYRALQSDVENSAEAVRPPRPSKGRMGNRN